MGFLSSSSITRALKWIPGVEEEDLASLLRDNPNETKRVEVGYQELEKKTSRHCQGGNQTKQNESEETRPTGRNTKSKLENNSP
jgi:hypothetical protein